MANKPSDWRSIVKYFYSLSSQISWASSFKREYQIFINRGRFDKFWFSSKTLIKILIKVWYIIIGQNKKGAKPSFNRNDLLVIVTDNPSYLQQLIPVIKHLVNNSHLDITLLCERFSYPYTKKYLNKQGISPSRINLFENIGKELRSSSVNGALGKMRTIFPQIKDDCKIWLSCDVRDKWLLLPTFFYYSLVYRYYSDLFDQEITSCQGVLSANDQWVWENLTFQTAKRNGIKSLVLQHGVITERYYPISADKIAVWNYTNKDFLTDSCNAAPEEILVSGSPYLSRLFINNQSNDADHFDKKYIVFFSSNFFKFSHVNSNAYEDIIDIFAGLHSLANECNKQLIIKLHPWDKKKYYKKWHSVFAFTKTPILDILDDTCIAMSIKSTSLFESSISGIPAFQIKTPDIKEFTDFSVHGITTTVESNYILDQEVRNLLVYEENYKQHVQKTQEALKAFFPNLGRTNEVIEDYFLSD